VKDELSMMNLEKGEHRNGNTSKMCWVVVTENESAKDSKEIDHKEKEHNNVSDRSETLHNEKHNERYKVSDQNIETNLQEKSTWTTPTIIARSCGTPLMKVRRRMSRSMRNAPIPPLSLSPMKA
jgi:BRCT domain type II-containing protein